MATAEFSKFPGTLSAALSQHHLSGFETAQLEFHHLHLALDERSHHRDYLGREDPFCTVLLYFCPLFLGFTKMVGSFPPSLSSTLDWCHLKCNICDGMVFFQ